MTTFQLVSSFIASDSIPSRTAAELKVGDLVQVRAQRKDESYPRTHHVTVSGVEFMLPFVGVTTVFGVSFVDADELIFLGDRAANVDNYTVAMPVKGAASRGRTGRTID